MCLPVLGHADQGLFTFDKTSRTEKALTADGVLEASVHYLQGGNDLTGNAERYQVLRSFRDYGFREEHVVPHEHVQASKTLEKPHFATDRL